MATIVSNNARKRTSAKRPKELGPVIQNALESLLYRDYDVVGMRLPEPGTMVLTLKPNKPAICPNCHKPCDSIHDTRPRMIRDVPPGGLSVLWIEVDVRRVRCSCGCHKTEELGIAAPRKQYTHRFAANIQWQMRANDTSTLAVASRNHIGWDVAHRLDKVQLETFFDEDVFTKATRIMIDEHSYKAGHHYVTLFVDFDSNCVMAGVVGKTMDAMRPVFEKLQKEDKIRHIQAVGCDMNSGYPGLIKEYLPNTDIVYDKFHIMDKLGDVIKEARQKQAEIAEEKYGKTSKEAKKTRRLLRCAEHILLASEDGLAPDAGVRIQEMLDNNKVMNSMMGVVSLIKSIWSAWSPREARCMLTDSIELLRRLADEYDLKKCRQFANTMENRAEGIITGCVHRITTGPLEGINRRCKLLQRLAYGIRDVAYYILKLKGAFPGTGNHPMAIMTRHVSVEDGLLYDTTLGHERYAIPVRYTH